MFRARKSSHSEAVDRMYMVMGIDEALRTLLELPGQVEQYVKAQKKEK